MVQLHYVVIRAMIAALAVSSLTPGHFLLLFAIKYIMKIVMALLLIRFGSFLLSLVGLVFVSYMGVTISIILMPVAKDHFK